MGGGSTKKWLGVALPVVYQTLDWAWEDGVERYLLGGKQKEAADRANRQMDRQDRRRKVADAEVTTRTQDGRVYSKNPYVNKGRSSLISNPVADAYLNNNNKSLLT